MQYFNLIQGISKPKINYDYIMLKLIFFSLLKINLNNKLKNKIIVKINKKKLQ